MEVRANMPSREKMSKASPDSLRLASLKSIKTKVDPVDLKELVSRHFPDYPNPDSFEGFALSLGRDSSYFVGHNEQLERLMRIEKAVHTLWHEYAQLPNSVQSATWHDVEFPLKESIAPMVLLLRRLVYEMTGNDPWPDGTEYLGFDHWPSKHGALEQAKAILTKLPDENPQQRKHRANDKAFLARIAVLIWEECTGKQAPSSPSASKKKGSFHAFVADLIELAGYDWGVKRVMSAYRKTDVGLKKSTDGHLAEKKTK